MTYKQKFNKFFDFNKDEPHSIDELAEISDIPLKILKEVEQRGLGAYDSNPESVRLKNFKKDYSITDMSKKLSAQQWAIARVYGFIMLNPKQINKGKPDRDLFEKLLILDKKKFN